MQKGQPAEARTLLEKASQADNNNAYVWSSLAEVYLRLHDLPKSSDAADRAEKLGANDPLVCHALSMYYSEVDQPARAAPLEQKFAESPRADAAALARAAGLYLAAGANDQAYALAERALQQHPSPAAEGVLGRVLMVKGQTQDAIPHLENAWNSMRPDEDATFTYVSSLLQVQAFAEAIDAVTQTLSLRQPTAQLELLLGVAQYGQRQFDQAIATFLKVIKLDGDVEQPYLFLGRLLEQAGSRLPDIIKADQAWAARNPNNAKAQLELAKALLQRNHSDAQAAALLARAATLDSTDWESHYQLGLLREGRRDFPAAQEEFQRSIALDKNQPMPHYHLARVYDRLGKSSEAEAERAIHTQMSATPAKDRK